VNYKKISHLGKGGTKKDKNGDWMERYVRTKEDQMASQ
jgi:hypothetical protein